MISQAPREVTELAMRCPVHARISSGWAFYLRQASSHYTHTMSPPEIILDRWVRTHLSTRPGFSGYAGKLNIEQVKSPSFRSFLYLIQEMMNEALRLENANASGGVEHPPFHFDYLDVSDGSENALAFQHDGFSFIVMTLPLVELVWDLSWRLSRSPVVLQLLRIDPKIVEPDAVQGLLFQIQLSFLVSHEYTHHIHRHLAEARSGVNQVWTEFPDDASCGNMNSQAQELDADGYASYVVLTFLLRGGGRPSALAQLGRTNAPSTEADELLLTCFVLAVFAFFCAFWHGVSDIASIHQCTHPPPPVRIKYTLQVAEMWCSQRGPVSQLSFSLEQFQELFRTAAEAIDKAAKQAWDAQMSFLKSADGTRYDQQLFEKFET
jgi:hypothetical protein